MWLTFIICTVACVLQSECGAPGYTPHRRRIGSGGPDRLGGTRGFGSSMQSSLRNENSLNRARAGSSKQEAKVKSRGSRRTEIKRITDRPRNLGSYSRDIVGVGDGSISDNRYLRSGFRSGGSRRKISGTQQFYINGTRPSISFGDGGRSNLGIGVGGEFGGADKSGQLVSDVKRYNGRVSVPSISLGSSSVGGGGSSNSSHMGISGSGGIGGADKSGQLISEVKRYNGRVSVPSISLGSSSVGVGGSSDSSQMGIDGSGQFGGGSKSGQFNSNVQRNNGGDSVPSISSGSGGVGGGVRKDSSHIEIGGSKRLGRGSKYGHFINDVQRYSGGGSVQKIDFGSGGVGSGTRSGSRHMDTVGSRKVGGVNKPGKFISSNVKRYYRGHSGPSKRFGSDGIIGVGRSASSHTDTVQIRGFSNGINSGMRSDRSLSGGKGYQRGGTGPSKGSNRESGIISRHIVTSVERLGNGMGSNDRSGPLISGGIRRPKDFRGGGNGGKSLLSASIRLPGIGGGLDSFSATKASHTSDLSRSSSDVSGGQTGRLGDSEGHSSRRQLSLARGTLPRENYFGRKGELKALPTLGGASADSQYADGIISAGVGVGYGTGSKRVHGDRLRSSRKGMYANEQERLGVPIGIAAQHTSIAGHKGFGGRGDRLFSLGHPQSRSSAHMHRGISSFGRGMRSFKREDMYGSRMESYPGSFGFSMYGTGHYKRDVSSMGEGMSYMEGMHSY